ncbi:MAG: NAD(P)H-hydrate epimerase [Pseudomonadota bacterium]
MTELLTAAQMRAIEAEAIASGRVTGLELMERAGQGVVDAVLAEWPELAEGARRAVVLCGPGNNGGDGFVVARLLKALGWDVEVFLHGEPQRLPPDAKANCERWLENGNAHTLRDKVMDGYLEDHPDIALVIDALFGTGLSRPVGMKYTEMELNTAQSVHKNGGPPVISIDVPSGLCADSGRYLGPGDDNPFDWCIMANLTVTFHRPKLGHYLDYGPKACGKIVIADIGL